MGGQKIIQDWCGKDIDVKYKINMRDLKKSQFQLRL